jgi:antitoxin component of MazEF toxin-antitoxin module
MMMVTRIGPGNTVTIPDDYRQMFRAGEEVAVSIDAQGRLIITPVENIREHLLETFGMWVDRTDMPADSLDYVNEIRRGERLIALGMQPNETH